MPFAAAPFSIRPEVAPDLARIAHELRRAVPFMEGDVKWHGLMEELLTYAAEAEHRIVAQSERIRCLEAQSETDELTGLLNRRGFARALARTLSAARRHGEEGLLIIADLDGFKPINDTHGHAAGDAALRAVASALKTNLRQTDYVARLGGDEFAVLLVKAEPAGAADRMAAVRALIEGAEAIYGGRPLTVGASLGSAAYNGETSAQHVMDAADAAMYQHKREQAAAR